MDSSGRVLWIEDDRIIGRSAPMPDSGRGALVLAALDAATDPDVWWPELAPLTGEERRFVRAQVRERIAR